MTEKRKRGRPKGTTIDDSKHLDAVADLMIRDPSLKKTPAIAKVVAKAFPEQKWEAANRRILRSWNKTAKERLDAAKERLQEEHHSRNVRQSRMTVPIIDALLPMKDSILAIQRLKEIDEIINPPALKALRRHQEIMDRINPPIFRELQRQQKAMQTHAKTLQL